MLTCTFHAGWCDVAVRAAVTHVALGIVIRPADNDVVDGLDVAEREERNLSFVTTF
jgi:lauroyl/myristoyl acyltransferase